MKVIVAGTRTFNDSELLDKTLQEFQNTILPIDQIVSGGSCGADLLGERWARQNKIDITYFYAEWNKYGKSAGPKRNQRMAEYADYLIAFWDEKSRGTADMIRKMRNEGKPVKIVAYKNLVDISFVEE
jgi:hypothetical protein